MRREAGDQGKQQDISLANGQEGVSSRSEGVKLFSYTEDMRLSEVAVSAAASSLQRR